MEGHSLNDRPRLAKVVAELLETLLPAGAVPTESALLDFLNGNEGREQVLEALDTLHRIGIHSIPKFIVEGKTLIDGAARPEVFVEVFREIEAKGKIHGGPVFSDILGISEELVARGSHLPKLSSM